MKTQLGLADDVSRMLEHIDEIGGPQFENHYPVGWSWAGSIAVSMDETGRLALRGEPATGW
jgi:hypothetical protein